MKKVIIVILCLLIIGGGIFAFKNYSKTETNEESQSVESKVESKEIESEAESKESTKQKGYDITLSKKELTIKKGSKESFDITFTNPDEMSIREYIHSDDQDDLISFQYTPLEDKKIHVEVDGLKVGSTTIIVSDYEYPDYKIEVKVNVVD